MKKNVSKVGANPLLDSLFQNAGIEANTSGMQKWSELDDIYQAVATAIVTTGTQINDCIRLINHIGVSDSKELETSINGLTRDIEQYSKDLVHIRSHHVQKTGIVKDGGDLALLLSLFEDYRGLDERFRANVFPVMLTVNEFLAEASSKEKASQDNGLLDPNVITDVEVKVPTND
jgi:hypothetical protein